VIRKRPLGCRVDGNAEDLDSGWADPDPKRLGRVRGPIWFGPDLDGAALRLDCTLYLNAVLCERVALDVKSHAMPLDKRPRRLLDDPALVDLPNDLQAEPVVLLLSRQHAQVA